MSGDEKSLVILMADDDEDDQKLAQDALGRVCAHATLIFVGNGIELLEYLRQQGRFAELEAAPRPRLILLDLNMPIKDGREALTEIKQDAALRSIPVVVLTTSEANEDVRMVYELGANAFITKPTSFSGLVQLMGSLCNYWLQMVRQPSDFVEEAR
jgi:CheY-like chemotaxis protein